MKTIKVTINNKRRHNATDEAIVFSTRLRKGRLIFVPFTIILSKETTEIQVNDVHIEPATTYELPLWFYNKREHDFLNMREDIVIEK